MKCIYRRIYAASAASLILGVAACEEGVESDVEPAVGSAELDLFLPYPPVRVTFPGPAGDIALEDGLLSGVLYRPLSYLVSTDLPAVVMMHGCTGMWQGNVPTDTSEPDLKKNVEKWGEKLAASGVVALAVDSYTRREFAQNQCGVDHDEIRAKDVNAARIYLAADPKIDGARIGLIGWSQDAQAAMSATAAIDPDTGGGLGPFPPPPFPGTVLFYPGCGGNLGFDPPSTSWRSQAIFRRSWRPRTHGSEGLGYQSEHQRDGLRR